MEYNDDPTLNEIRYSILNEKRGRICQFLNAERHLIFLQSKFVLSEEDCEVIRSKVTRKEKADSLVTILLSKGPRCLEYLCQALDADGTQIFLLKELNMLYEKRRNNYLSLFKLIGPQSPMADLHIDERLLPLPPPIPPNNNSNNNNNNNLPYHSGSQQFPASGRSPFLRNGRD